MTTRFCTRIPPTTTASLASTGCEFSPSTQAQQITRKPYISARTATPCPSLRLSLSRSILSLHLHCTSTHTNSSSSLAVGTAFACSVSYPSHYYHSTTLLYSCCHDMRLGSPLACSWRVPVTLRSRAVTIATSLRCPPVRLRLALRTRRAPRVQSAKGGRALACQSVSHSVCAIRSQWPAGRLMVCRGRARSECVIVCGGGC